MDYKRVTKKGCSIARQRADRLISAVRKDIKHKYTFEYRLVGSGKWGTMIKDKNEKYDLDYQLLLTHNSKEYKKNQFNNPAQIKKDFLKLFDQYKNDKECFQDSTTAITLEDKDEKPYSIDFVIIFRCSDNSKIIRRNNKSETPSKNEYTWNQLGNVSEIYSYFKKLNSKEKRFIIEKVIQKKYEEKQKDDGDPSKKSSVEIFSSCIAEHKNEHPK